MDLGHTNHDWILFVEYVKDYDSVPVRNFASNGETKCPTEMDKCYLGKSINRQLELQLLN